MDHDNKAARIVRRDTWDRSAMYRCNKPPSRQGVGEGRGERHVTLRYTCEHMEYDIFEWSGHRKLRMRPRVEMRRSLESHDMRFCGIQRAIDHIGSYATGISLPQGPRNPSALPRQHQRWQDYSWLYLGRMLRVRRDQRMVNQ